MAPAHLPKDQFSLKLYKEHLWKILTNNNLIMYSLAHAFTTLITLFMNLMAFKITSNLDSIINIHYSNDYSVNTTSGVIKFNFCTFLVSNPCKGYTAGYTTDNTTCTSHLGSQQLSDVKVTMDPTRVDDDEG